MLGRICRTYILYIPGIAHTVRGVVCFDVVWYRWNELISCRPTSLVSGHTCSSPSYKPWRMSVDYILEFIVNVENNHKKTNTMLYTYFIQIAALALFENPRRSSDNLCHKSVFSCVITTPYPVIVQTVIRPMASPWSGIKIFPHQPRPTIE